MRNAAVYSLVFSVAASLVLYIFSDYFSLYVLGDARSAMPLRILAFSLVPLSLSSMIGGYFVGVKRVVKNAVAQVLCQTFKIAVTVLFVMRFSYMGAVYTTIGLTLAISLTEAFGFFVVLIEYILDRKRLEKGKGRLSAKMSDITSMALPLALSAYIRSALLTLEHSLIPKGLIKRGESVTQALAAYGVLHGMTLPMLIYPMAVLSSFAGLLVPEFAESRARGEDLRMRRIAGEALEATLVYSSAATVFMYLFAEELGYVMYDSYYAGRYIALMSFVIPIMYLDHVADSMLKGIGEHVYSMWVNILDALISVILVWVLIPVMGIGGYAVVIVVMEGFNFLLSITRLYKKIRFRLNLIKSFVIPVLCAALSALISRGLFNMCGSEAEGLGLVMKLIFAVCCFIAAYKVVSNIKIGNGRKVPLPKSGNN